tara:strand:- start:1454 stop:2320 length:867 start_codon:yes stop_codon:yes gene_type:complete
MEYDVSKGNHLHEGTQNQTAILLDGTSSSGKSYGLGQLIKRGDIVAKSFTDSPDSNEWVIIGSDDFSGGENGIKYDHAGKGRDQKAGEEFHKLMATERKGGFGEKRGETTVGFHKHPKNKEVIPGSDSRSWYMAQEFIHGGWEKVIFDDISGDIKKYLPDVKFKHILIHAPLYTLFQNVGERNKKKKDDFRDPKGVLKQYLEKYEATKSKPREEDGDPFTVLTRKSVKKMLLQNNVDEKFTDDFIQKLGLKDDGDYYIKVKSGQKGNVLINIDKERTVYMDKIMDVIK